MSLVRESRGLTARLFALAAEEYERALTMEQLMESTPQATQRGITLASLSLVAAQVKGMHVRNELLVQDWAKGEDRPVQAVPDNLVILHDGPLDAESSYDIPLQPARPLLAIEYVSKRSKRKDHETNREKYEGMKIRYYLMYHPEIEEVTLFRLKGKKYVSVKPDRAGRCRIPELDLEVGVMGGWMRYWFRGELVPLPPELQASLAETRRELAATQGALATAQGALATTEGALATTQGALATTEEALRLLQEEKARDAAVIAELRRQLGERAS